MSVYYGLFGLVVRVLGNSPARTAWLGDLLGNIRNRYGYIGQGRSREAYLDAIRVAFPDLARADASKLLQKFWRHHQRSFLELFCIPSMSDEEICSWVSFEGLDILDGALGKGRGVVLAVPHMSNERLLHIALAAKGYQVYAVTSRYSDMSGMAAKTKLKASLAHHDLGYAGSSPKWIFSALKKNAVVQIAPTAEPGPKGLYVKFLHARIGFASGPARIACKSGAAMIPAFTRRTPEGHHVEIAKPINTSSNDPASITRAFVDWTEKAAGTHPDQVNWMWWINRLEKDGNMRAARFVCG